MHELYVENASLRSRIDELEAEKNKLMGENYASVKRETIANDRIDTLQRERMDSATYRSQLQEIAQSFLIPAQRHA